MRELSGWGLRALCAAVLAGCAAAVSVCPGRTWLLRAALYTQDPAAAATLTWPTPPAQSVYKPQKPEPRSTPQPTASPSPAPTAAPTPTPTTTPLPSAAPPLENAGRIRAVTLKQGSGSGYVQLAAGSIRNSTEHPDADLRAAVTTQSLPFAVEKNSDEPQLLIMHTHATESYQTWPDPVFDPDYTARSKNTALNMCAVGAEMARVLNAAGINTLHDATLYDAPGYTDSYKRSRAGVQAYLEQYPSIKVVLDVHRDAIEDSDGTRVKPVCELDGESAAQVMIIAGCDNGASVPLPDWRLNLRFAAAWEAEMEKAFPGLTRPVLCGYRFYNQDLTTGSLLIEIGGHANTLDEALCAARHAAEALAAVLG
ncbi:stage II sporulation protein P [Gemmiger formicilis]|uniref:stage II sporulation protein P n=1 Tax=Gemmiger formicilis TaxID=745368 RepID=UPI00210EF374|nr:stage II sporulation protein P [Gemmiger formicilis]MCQ5079535.1 stage II sporulation protein P [Gemmiger formicilis]MCQ5115934.1 stage II sporulation protein P [Gemmiger formicilis]